MPVHYQTICKANVEWNCEMLVAISYQVLPGLLQKLLSHGGYCAWLQADMVKVRPGSLRKVCGKLENTATKVKFC